jgi:nitroreductase
MFRNMLKKAIHKSQHVQRNWDLNKSIPEEDLELIAEAVTQAPSKQNVTFF